MLVALLALIPVVGSTIGGIMAPLVALTKGLAVALATPGLRHRLRVLRGLPPHPQVMRHPVQLSPALTVIATLIGGVLLGLIGR